MNHKQSTLSCFTSIPITRICSYMLVILLAFNTSAYSREKSTKKKKAKGSTILVWNEDLKNSYLLKLTGRNNFEYIITKEDSLTSKTEKYHGTYTCLPGIINLNYANGVEPKDIVNYLFLEASGIYLIQYFKGGKERIFLREPLVSPLLGYRHF